MVISKAELSFFQIVNKSQWITLSIIHVRDYNPNKGSVQVDWIDTICFRIVGVME